MTEKYESAPYPGLRPFEADEESLFFGRETQVDELLRRLGTHRFLAVVGTSGSGKSSLVRAGLFPAIHGGFMANTIGPWRIAILRPGSSPVANLANALDSASLLDGLRSDDNSLRVGLARAILERGSLGLVEVLQQRQDAERENVLIVVDQFEELFRFANASGAQAPDEAAAFVKLLLAGATHTESSIRVLITMRSDFLGNCARFRDLPEAVNDGMFLIPRMTRDQLRLAIEAPARVVGAAMTPRLVNRLLNDLGDDPDELPVLAHALMRTWNYWVIGRGAVSPLDIADYQATGGMQHALSRHGDEIFEGLPSDRSRMLAERAFKALTELGEDNRGIRRPTRFESLCAIVDSSPEELCEIVNAFRASRCSFLMPPAEVPLVAGTVIDICHESLMRKWPRLDSWVREEAVSVESYRRLAAAASLNRAGKAALWRDPDLSYAIQWRENNLPNEGWGTRDGINFTDALRFLECSIAAHRAEISRKRRSRVVTTGALIAISIVLATLAFITHAQAVQAKASLRSSQEIVLGNIALGLPTTRTQDAMVLAAEASNSGALPSRNALYTLLGRNPRLRRIFYREGTPTFDRSGRFLAMANSSDTGSLDVYDTKTQEIVGGGKERMLSADPIVGECFQNGNQLIAITRGGHALTFNWRTRRRIALTDLHAIARSVGCSESSEMMAIATAGGTVLVLNDLQRQVSTALSSRSEIWSVAISPLDETIVAGADGGKVLLYNPRSLRRLSCAIGIDAPVNRVHFASDATFVVMSSGDASSYRMSVGSCATRRSQAVAPLSDVVSYADDRTIDALMDGRVMSRAQGVSTGEFAPSLSSNASSIISNGSEPDTLGGWVALSTTSGVLLYATGEALRPMHAEFTVPAEQRFPVAIAFSADSTRVMLGTSDGVRQWNVSTAQALRNAWHADRAIEAIAFAPGGQETFAVWGNTVLAKSMVANEPSIERDVAGIGNVAGVVAPYDGSSVSIIGRNGSVWKNDLIRKSASLIFRGDLHGILSSKMSPNGDYFVANFPNVSKIYSSNGLFLSSLDSTRSFIGFTDDSTAFFERHRDEIRRRRLPDGVALPGAITLDTSASPTVATNTHLHWIAIAPNDPDVPQGIQLYDDTTFVKVGFPLPLPALSKISQMQFSADGNWLAAYSNDGKLYVYELALATWQQRACTIADKTMSQADWNDYGAGFPYQDVCSKRFM